MLSFNLFAFVTLRFCKSTKKAFTQASRASGIKLCYKHGRKNYQRYSQNLRKNEVGNQQKNKNSRLSSIYWFYKKSALRIIYFWKTISLSTNNLNDAFQSFKKLQFEKSCLFSHWAKNMIKFCSSLANYYWIKDFVSVEY